jgi:hypothetical protein
VSGGKIVIAITEGIGAECLDQGHDISLWVPPQISPAL